MDGATGGGGRKDIIVSHVTGYTVRWLVIGIPTVAPSLKKCTNRDI